MGFMSGLGPPYFESTGRRAGGALVGTAELEGAVVAVVVSEATGGALAELATEVGAVAVGTGTLGASPSEGAASGADIGGPPYLALHGMGAQPIPSDAAPPVAIT